MQAATSGNTSVVPRANVPSSTTLTLSHSRNGDLSKPTTNGNNTTRRSSYQTSIPDLVSETVVNRRSNKESTHKQQEKERPLDDLDLMICHEEFPRLVALAAKVKAIKKLQQSCQSAEDHYRQNRPEIANSSLAPTEDVFDVGRMQEKLSVKNVIVMRGSYPLTDAMMDENFSILQQELDFCQSCLGAAGVGKNISQNGQGDAIAVKYSKWQTDILMNWIIKHKADPFPSSQEIHKLMEQTGLSRSQVVNWTANVRKRNQKGTLEGKKPHHFIDFVFLAQERDNKKARGTKAESSKWMTTQSPQHYVKPANSTPTSGTYSSSSYLMKPAQTHYPPFAYRPSTSNATLYSPPVSCAQTQYASYYMNQKVPHLRMQNHANCYLQKGDWNVGLKTVTESFEDTAMEPIESGEDVDVGLLMDFARHWLRHHMSPDASVIAAEELMKQDMPSSDDDDEWMQLDMASFNYDDELKIDMTFFDYDDDGKDEHENDDESMEELEPRTVDPPELKGEFTFALDWQDWDLKKSTNDIGIDYIDV